MTGVILGIGLMGAIDTIVFHQLLQWHNFYIDATPYWRVFSDGLLHTFTAGMLALGALRLWSARKLLARAGRRGVLAAGFLLGAGGFQLWDGVVHHKILRLHPVREGVGNQLPYDLAWNGGALLLLLLGFLVWRRMTRAASRIEGKPE